MPGHRDAAADAPWFRISRSICCCYHRRRADQVHHRDQEDPQSVLERNLRFVRCPTSCAGPRKLTRGRRASEESILAIQIFDQKKFKKKDQGFLGVINVRIGSVIDLDVGGDGTGTPLCYWESLTDGERHQRCLPGTLRSPTTISLCMENSSSIYRRIWGLQYNSRLRRAIQAHP